MYVLTKHTHIFNQDTLVLNFISNLYTVMCGIPERAYLYPAAHQYGTIRYKIDCALLQSSSD